MSAFIAIAADLLVAILLVATIATSLRLSRRVARMKADEAAMRTVVAELVSATASAERAIGGLRLTVSESEQALTERLSAAARHAARLAEQVEAGEAVLAKVSQVAALSRRLNEPAPRPEPAAEPADGLHATIRAAREVALRSARRLEGRAA